MFQGFSIKGRNFDNIEDWKNIGNDLYFDMRVKIEEKLSFLHDKECILDAEKIQGDWFPKIKADVFISHSHKDIDLAIAFAGWLKQNFGLTSFIDYCLWGYCDNLLKMIDDNFCKNKNKNTYDYKTRNASTSIVHMLLMNALTKMIDNTECIMFLDTPNAIVLKDDVSRKTYSPWIFSELETTRIIRRIIPDRLNGKLKREIKCFSAINESQLKVAFPVNTSHLIDLNCDDLIKWQEMVAQDSRYYCLEGKKSLDYLYRNQNLI